MILKEHYNIDYMLKSVIEYEKKYKDILDDSEKEFLLKNCFIGEQLDVVPYILTQFYTEYNFIKDEKNIYVAILKKLKEAFELKKKNILEVGGGPVPVLGRMISKETDKEVTIIDPNITINNNGYKNISIVKKMFLPYTDISKYDLITAFMACGSSEMILHNCAENNKDFFIGICPCGKEGIDGLLGTNLTNEQYIEGIIELAEKKVKEHKMGELIIDKLDETYCYSYPIIYNKRPKTISYKKRDD